MTRFVLFLVLACGLLAGCSPKATLCTSEYMQAQMKTKFGNDLNERYLRSGIDLVATGLVSNVRFDELETINPGGDGEDAFCSATIHVDVAGKTIEDGIGYFVISQKGKDTFRIYNDWPWKQLEAALNTGPMGKIWEKEREINHMEIESVSDVSPELKAELTQKLKVESAALESMRERIKSNSPGQDAGSTR